MEIRGPELDFVGGLKFDGLVRGIIVLRLVILSGDDVIHKLLIEGFEACSNLIGSENYSVV